MDTFCCHSSFWKLFFTVYFESEKIGVEKYFVNIATRTRSLVIKPTKFQIGRASCRERV